MSKPNRIAKSFIHDLLLKAKIERVVGAHVKLKNAGSNMIGLCPFHNEKSPSFSVNPEKQFYHCFGCGCSGNAIGFLMNHLDFTFVESVENIAESINLDIVYENQSNAISSESMQVIREKRTEIATALDVAAAFYYNGLKKNAVAIDYLKGRKITGQTAKEFMIGYAESGFQNLETVFNDYHSQTLLDAGLVAEKDERRFDRFRSRIMFPIRNMQGKIIGFGGRVLDDSKPKYLNSAEGELFKKSLELYGLFEARKSIKDAGYILVLEGYMDVIALSQHGVKNVVATMGTACTQDHIRKLFQITDHVIFCFDGDNAGQDAAVKAMQNILPALAEKQKVSFITLPKEHDPDSLVTELGADEFQKYVDSAQSLSQCFIRHISRDCNLSTPDGKALLLDQARELWIGMADGSLKGMLLIEIANITQMNRNMILNIWKTTYDEGRAFTANKQQQSAVASNTGNSQKYIGQKGGNHRCNHIAGILLMESELFASLNQDDLNILYQAGEPFAPLFKWLEAQSMEYGASPWGVLRESLKGEPFEVFALQLAEQHSNLKTLEHARDALKYHLSNLHLSSVMDAQAELFSKISQNKSPELMKEFLKFQEVRAIFES